MSGGAVMVGGVVSLSQCASTVTVCVQVAVRPSASVTVQRIEVTPIGYGSVNGFDTAGVMISPSSSSTAGVLSLRRPVTVPPPLAVKVGVPTATVSSPELSVSLAILLAGQLMVGAGVSSTFTVKLQLPPPDADEVTVCVPTAKNEPDTGLLVIAPQSPSVEAAPYVTNAPSWLSTVVFAVATTLAGQVSVQVWVASGAPTATKILATFGFGGGAGVLFVYPVIEGRIKILRVARHRSSGDDFRAWRGRDVVRSDKRLCGPACEACNGAGEFTHVVRSHQIHVDQAYKRKS